MANRGMRPQPAPGLGRQGSTRDGLMGTVSPEQVAAAQALESHLHQLSDEILLSAGADGVAIALAGGGDLRCRASSGIAPPRGTHIDARSGLTGACLSTGTVLRCDDTEEDVRVDQQVCRAIGIRAVVCVPVTSGHEMVGIFEIFSSRAGAFREIDIDGLRAIAEEIAHCFEAEEALSRASVAVTADLGAAGELPPPWVPLSAPPLPRRPMSPATRKKWRTVLGILVVALGLFLLLRAVRSPQAPLAQAAPPAASGSLAAGAASNSQALERQQRVVYPRDKSSRRGQAQTVSSVDSGQLPAAPGNLSKRPEASLASPPVLIGAENRGSDPLGTLVSSLPIAQPAPPPPLRVSSGIAEPVLLHRVDPVYPAMAKQGRIEGAVVVDATVDKEGKISAARVVSGNALLAGAALRAVQQWRYEPYRLNGAPIAVPVKITLNFELNQ